MRSYAYSDDGSLQPCHDPLPATVASSSGGRTSKEFDSYEAAMKKTGFLLSKGSTYMSRMGSITVYARNHATLAAQRAGKEDFDFCCVLAIGGSYIRIWVTDFPSVFLFFRDIGAKVEENTVDRESWALRENASRVLGELLTGDLTLRVDTSS